MRQVTLTHGKWMVELTPEIGGSISRCAYDGQDVMRPATRAGDAGAEARDMSCFPLVPFSNRIEYGRFEFGGRSISLPKNMGDHPHALHGQGWRGAWYVPVERPDRATLAYDHEADAWPWRYQATQRFELADDSLTLYLGVTNLSDDPMPVGLGLHPYFLASQGTTLTTGVTHLWETTNEQIPIQRVDLPAQFDFARGLRIADHDLDHCFAGWNRVATIDWPGRPYRLHMEGRSPSLQHFVLYTPRGQDFFCAEGVENMNNAYNWMSRDVFTGLTVLAPGDSHEVETVFRVEAVSA
jgi:aldose 1-epimerase